MPGPQLVGKVSWFGGPHDPEDSGHTASGGRTSEPGIAVYNHQTLGGYWRVTDPRSGRAVVLRQTDIGPAPWTGRKIDVTYSALGRFGYHEGNFPTDAQWHAEYLGHNAPPAGDHETTPTQATFNRGSAPEVVRSEGGGQQVDPQALGELLADVKAMSGPAVSAAAGASPTLPSFAATPPMPAGARTPAGLAPVQKQPDLTALAERVLAGGNNVESSVRQARGPSVSYAPAGSQPHAGGPLAGLLPAHAMLKLGRIDEGQDGQTNPGGAILANGHGEVVAVKSDPTGFGPSYPLVVFRDGPLAGLGPIYFGHTIAARGVGQKLNPGDVISRTGTHGVGNATVPGWFEIGLGNTLGQGDRGQGAQIAPHLR